MLKNWNFFRVVRLALGLYVMIQAIATQIWILAAFGLWFTLMPLLNIGCGATGCSVPRQKADNKEIEYEEIK